MQLLLQNSPTFSPCRLSSKALALLSACFSCSSADHRLSSLRILSSFISESIVLVFTICIEQKTRCIFSPPKYDLNLEWIWVKFLNSLHLCWLSSLFVFLPNPSPPFPFAHLPRILSLLQAFFCRFKDLARSHHSTTGATESEIGGFILKSFLFNQPFSPFLKKSNCHQIFQKEKMWLGDVKSKRVDFFKQVFFFFLYKNSPRGLLSEYHSTFFPTSSKPSKVKIHRLCWVIHKIFSTNHLLSGKKMLAKVSRLVENKLPQQSQERKSQGFLFLSCFFSKLY